MKEEALKLADALERNNWHLAPNGGDMIRKLVAELDKQGERISELEYEKNVLLYKVEWYKGP